MSNPTDLSLRLGIDTEGAPAAARQVETLAQSVEGVENAAAQATGSVRGFADSFDDLRGAISALAVGALAQEFVRLNSQYEANLAALKQLTGGQEAAEAALARIGATADRLGRSAMDLTEQYVQLAAATKNTALEGAATDAVFGAVVGAMGKLGRSSEETSRALAAVAQMASKGVVSAEEMRGQLGEALPGAMQALANATGLPVVKLNEMMESGQLLAADVLPALAKGLNDTFGTDQVQKVDSLGASFERLKNSLAGAFTQIGQAGVSDLFAGTMDKAAYVVRGLTAGTVSLGQQIGITTAHLVDSNSTWDAYTQAIAENTAEWDAYIDGAQAGAQATSAVSEASAEAAAASLRAASAYTEAAQSAEAAVKLTDKQRAATDAAAKSSLTWTKVLGTEKDQLKATLDVGLERLASLEKDTAATSKAATINRERLAALNAEIEGLRASGEAEGQTAEQIQGAIAVKQKSADEIAKKLALQEAEIDKLAQEKTAQEAANVAAKLAAATYGDQSDQLGRLTDVRDRANQANEAAAQKLEALKAINLLLLKQQKDLQQAQEDGLNVAEALNDTNRQLSESTAAVTQAERDSKEAAKVLAESKKLVTDASKDYQQKLKAESDAIADQVAASNTLLETKGIELKRRQAVAQAMGDEQAAASLSIQAARLEVQAIQANAVALRDRAELAAQAAEARKQELIDSGKYEGALKAETEAQLRSAEAMQLEADKLDAVAKAKKTDISLSAQLADAQNAVNQVVAEYSNKLDDAAEANQRIADAAKQAGEAAIQAGKNQYEAAEAARQAAEAAIDAAQKKAKADRESVVYTDQISAALNALADQYAWLGNTSVTTWLRSKDALGQYWQAWERGTIASDLAALEDRLKGIGNAAANIDRLTAALQSGTWTAKDLANATSAARTSAEALGAERLEALRAAIQAAQQDMADLKREADDTLASWQDKLDQLNGDELSIAERKRLSDLTDLQDQLNAAIAAGNADAAAQLRAAISTAEQYWSTYISGLKAAANAAKTATLPGITDNGDGSISSNLPTTRSGGGTDTGTVSGALNTSGASMATIAKADLTTLSDGIGATVSGALATLVAEIRSTPTQVVMDGQIVAELLRPRLTRLDLLGR